MKRLLVAIFALCIALPASAAQQVRVVMKDGRRTIPVYVVSTEGPTVEVTWTTPLKLCGSIPHFYSLDKEQIDRAVDMNGAEVNFFMRRRRSSCDSGSCSSSSSCSTSNSNPKANPVSLLAPPGPPAVAATQPSTGSDMNVDAVAGKIGDLQQQISSLKDNQDKLTSDVKQIAGSMTASQPGPAGPAGPQGPAGIAGTAGTNGKDGASPTIDMDALASAVQAKLPQQTAGVTPDQLQGVVGVVSALQKQVAALQKARAATPFDAAAAAKQIAPLLPPIRMNFVGKGGTTLAVPLGSTVNFPPNTFEVKDPSGTSHVASGAIGQPLAVQLSSTTTK